MNYNIKGTEVAITPELRAYVEKKLEQADKFLANDPTALIDVELEFAAGEGGKKYRVELTLTATREMHRAEARGEALHEAIDLCIEELMQELRRTKEKRTTLVRRGAARIKDFVRGFGRRP